VRKHLSPGVVLGIIAIVIATTGSATAASLITSAKIKNGTIRGKDIAKRTISMDHLSRSVQQAIHKAGTPGQAGATGAQGLKGEKGDTGATGATLQPSPGITPTAGHWGVVDRNTIGSPSVQFRSGPASPPLGKGSLSLAVGNPAEKAAFGNEIDFAGQSLADIDKLSFSVYQTGEDTDPKNQGGPDNIPSIGIEIDPTGATDTPKLNFSTLVSVPTAVTPNKWSRVDVSGGEFFLTGQAGTDSHCNQTTYCTLDEVKAAFPDATLYSVQITKGRDYAFQGDVDALQVNGTVFDFEETGVFTGAA
jgi:hypothetical protein